LVRETMRSGEHALCFGRCKRNIRRASPATRRLLPQ
jgi:hypothetical protein